MTEQPRQGGPFRAWVSLGAPTATPNTAAGSAGPS